MRLRLAALTSRANAQSAKTLRPKVARALAVLFFFSVVAIAAHAAAGGASVTLNAPPNDLGLVGYWSFDSGDVSGTTVLDQSGDGNNGTTANDPKQVPGKLAQALSFNGTSQYVSVPYSASLAPPVVSVSAWAYYNSVPGNSDIVVRPYRASGWTSPYVSYNIQGSGGGGWVLWNVAVGGTLHQVPGPVISIHKWYHFVGTYDGTPCGSMSTAPCTVQRQQAV